MPITEARKETNRKWREAHPETYKTSIAKAQKKYYDENKESILKKKREYYQKKKALKDIKQFETKAEQQVEAETLSLPN